jgi:hypothetical protein
MKILLIDGPTATIPFILMTGAPERYHSRTSHESHRGILKRMQLRSGETKISHFEHVSS